MMISSYEQQGNGDYVEIVTREDGTEAARFYRAARRLKTVGDTFQAVDHTGAEIAFTGTIDGVAVVNGAAPIPVPTDDQVLKARPIPQQLTPTSAAGKPALLEFMRGCVADAQSFDWFNTKLQADGALTAAQKTAAAALNTSLYVRARAAVAAWYQAT